MRYWERFIIYPILGITFIFSLAILCRLYPRITTPVYLGFDYLGLIIGILSLLVTALLGWQIFNIISFENTVDKKLNTYNKAYKVLLGQEIAKTKIDILRDMRISDIDGHIINIDTIFKASYKIPDLIHLLPRDEMISEFHKEIDIMKNILYAYSSSYAPMHIDKLRKVYFKYTDIHCVNEFTEYLDKIYATIIKSSENAK